MWHTHPVVKKFVKALAEYPQLIVDNSYQKRVRVERNGDICRVLPGELKIVSCREVIDRGYSKMIARLEDGSSEHLFGYYLDELLFSTSEFIGLTVKEAINKYHERDIAYLRS